MKKNLAEWLSYIERLHPKTIAMGLSRVNQMISRLHLHPTFKIFMVTGTNGKGSTCAMLASIYAQAGYQVACYTSPHLLHYNERVWINQLEISDDDLCLAFAAVESARLDHNDEIQLTYFEFGTLAAIWHFMQQPIDIAILEIGLGGRLDAVNAFEPDCAIVTNVDLDHQEYLGETREQIGFEKAGIYRPHKPAICGDFQPPASLLRHAKAIQADLYLMNQDIKIKVNVDDWQVELRDDVNQLQNISLPYPALIGSYQFNNAACVVASVSLMQQYLPVNARAIQQGLQQVTLPGRFESVALKLTHYLHMPDVLLDVAHNPHAAHVLANNLLAYRFKHYKKQDKTIAVFAMLSDKNIKGVVQALQHVIDVWFVASIDQPRGAHADEVAQIIRQLSPKANITCYVDAGKAFQAALVKSQDYITHHENVKIIVFGSFYTVATVKQFILASTLIN